MAKQGLADDALILLDDLAKKSPADPMLDLGYGMVYGQSGSTFSAKRSAAALQRFLDSQGAAISEDYKTILVGFIEKLKKGQALDHDVHRAAQSPSQATGSLTVTSPKVGKIKIDGGEALDIQAGQQLQWDDLAVGKYAVEVVAGDQNWKGSVDVAEKTVVAATATFPARAGDSWSVDLGGGVQVEFVWIPPGKFSMGSPQTEAGHRKDEIQHEVTLSRGFWMGKYEVTRQQYQKLMQADPSRFKTVGPAAPVDGVSWNMAKEFCDKMQKKVDTASSAGERAPDKSPQREVRLPTEAEWEYACRAGTTEAYAGNLEAMAWHDKNSGRSTHPVGQKQANAWGLYDMHGNVWEWCLDAKKPFTSSAETDPVGVGRDRVLRGGGFFSKSSQCRSAFRFDWLPKLAVDDSGFRVIVLQYD